MSGKKLPHSGNSLPIEGTVSPQRETLQNGTDFLLLSGVMQRLRVLASQVASSDAPVLIHGETGTGKELFARLIHDMGIRAKKPFVAVNCGVHEGELFADKFFGHEQGAFTGAHRMSQGCFELASEGTLFLDEVGEIPGANQADFLRVLEEKRFRRVSSPPRTVICRRWWGRGSSGPTSSTGSMSFPWSFRPCVPARRRSCRWHGIS